MATFRLHTRHHTITRGPLALIAAQAHRHATTTGPIDITDRTGTTITVHNHNGTIRTQWQHPTQLALFTAVAISTAPSWHRRLETLLAELNPQEPELPPTATSETEPTP